MRRSAQHYHRNLPGFSFADFITNTGLIALISLVAVVIYFYVIFKKELLKGAVTERDPSA